MRWIVVLAGILGFLAVLIGAFGAHGLEKNLESQGFNSEEIIKKIEQCEIAVRYHMYHVLALLCIGLFSTPSQRKLASVSAILILCGIALFSGGLYSMVFLDEIGHWAIVPMGGLFFMLGWLGIVGMGLLQGKKNAAE